VSLVLDKRDKRQHQNVFPHQNMTSMTKKERDNAARRKRKKDPNQPKKTGAAKPTYVKTDPQKGGRKKKKEGMEMNKQRLMEIINEELERTLITRCLPRAKHLKKQSTKEERLLLISQ
jgi:hypothetical protein